MPTEIQNELQAASEHLNKALTLMDGNDELDELQSEVAELTDQLDSILAP
jgi:hypothetical protein